MLSVIASRNALLVLLAACSATPSPAPALPPRPPPPPSSPAPPIAPRDPIRASPNVALGVPVDADPSDELLLDRHVFVASYDDRRGAPNWVSWRLVRADLGPVHRPRDAFHADHELPRGAFVVEPSDYAKSGFDRGHLCPSADRTADDEDNRATFLMTNMVAQRHALNVGPWEELEKRERALAESGDVLFVVAGALFDRDPPRLGRGVAVPRATYKIVVDLKSGDGPAAVSGETQIIAALMPNDDAVSGHDYGEYLTTVAAIERASGYAFMSEVAPDIRAILRERAPLR